MNLLEADGGLGRAVSASTARPGTGAQLAGLVALMRAESALDSLGGRAMLNALSTAMFTLILRLAGEANEAPAGLLALAGYPRLAPACVLAPEFGAVYSPNFQGAEARPHWNPP